MRTLLIFAFLGLIPAVGQASTELTSHSYVHNPSGQVHLVLHLANYKRGLFFGSCGPSTRSLQWEYTIELRGDGPGYHQEDIEVKDGNFHILPLESGQVQVDRNKSRVSIALRINQGSGPKEFAGNGAFKLKQKS